MGISIDNSNGSANHPSKTMGPVYKAPTTGIFRFLPAALVPYAELMRLDRPAGYYAFYWHFAIGLSFGACITPEAPTPSAFIILATYLALWVVVLRGAVCTWNDNMDQEFDRKVARCRFRPIARGAVSTGQGHLFTVGQMVVGAVMLFPIRPTASVYAGIMTVILAIYPFGKRITDFPQVILGFGLAMPIFLCNAALDTDPLLQAEAVDEWKAPALLGGATCLYGANILWTIIFDTVYAHQDIKDDVKAGVRSLAVRLGSQTKPGLGILAGIQVALLVATGWLCEFPWPYFLIACGGAGLSVLAMLVLVDLERPASCAWWFGPGSRLVGTSVVFGILSHYIARLKV